MSLLLPNRSSGCSQRAGIQGGNLLLTDMEEFRNLEFFEVFCIHVMFL